MKKNNQSRKSTALDIFYRVLSNFSTRCLFRLAKYLSVVVAHTKNKILSQTRENIKRCFPLLTASQQQELVNTSLHHTSCAFFELAVIWNKPIKDVLSLITSTQIEESFYDRNKPKIIIAPHHGSWELLNLWLANEGPLYSLYKPAKSENIDQYVFTKRSRNSATLVPANTSGLRKLLKGLKNNSTCMILPDQRPAKGTAQIYADFYDHSAPTSLLIKKLASKVDCNIFIASVTRELNSGQYNLVIKSLNRSKFISDDIHSATYLNKSIVEFINQNEPQYQWAYRRF